MRTPMALRISAGKNRLRQTKGASLLEKNSRRVTEARIDTDSNRVSSADDSITGMRIRSFKVKYWCARQAAPKAPITR